MPEVLVNIEVYCAECGAGICHLVEATKTHNRQEPCFRIQPCEQCMQKRYDEGYADGWNDGIAARKDG